MYNYEVYAAADSKGNWLYVGSGLKGRHKHLSSGKSHNSDVNRYYFSNPVGFDKIVVQPVKTKKRSLELEKELVKMLKPRFNKVTWSDEVIRERKGK